MRIIDAHYLRREIARDETMRRDEPERWRRQEAQRRLRNREKVELNRMLRAAGCRPMDLEPSLAQKMKKLQRLDATNRAEIERLRTAK